MGTNRVSASRLFEIAQILNVPPSFFFDGLREKEMASKQDIGLKIIDAVAGIEDERVKERVVTFIEDVSGVTVLKTRGL